MNPKVSIITPIYNGSDYIQRCVESLLAQTLKELEIILIDDGSTDDSMQKVQSLVHGKHFVRVIHQENQGSSGARNTGLRVAKGDYLTFVDSDDTISSNFCEVLYQTAKQNDSDLVIAKMTRRGDSWVISNKIIDKSKLQSKKNRLIHCLQEKIHRFNCAKLYKRELFRNKKFMVGRIYEDQILIPQIVAEANNICFNHQAEYIYYFREDSNSNTFSEKRIEDRLFAIQCNIDLARKHQFTTKEMRAYLIKEFNWGRFIHHNYKPYQLAQYFGFPYLAFFCRFIDVRFMLKQKYRKVKYYFLSTNK